MRSAVQAKLQSRCTLDFYARQTARSVERVLAIVETSVWRLYVTPRCPTKTVYLTDVEILSGN